MWTLRRICFQLLFLFLLLTALFFQLLLQLKLIYIIQLLLQLQLTEGTLHWAPWTCTETLRCGRGQHTETTLTRNGKIIGSLGPALDAAFPKQVRETDYAGDVREFCAEYAQDKLFDHVPGRQHQSFPSFTPRVNIAQPHKLKRRLINYGRKLDQCRLVFA